MAMPSIIEIFQSGSTWWNDRPTLPSDVLYVLHIEHTVCSYLCINLCISTRIHPGNSHSVHFKNFHPRKQQIRDDMILRLTTGKHCPSTLVLCSAGLEHGSTHRVQQLDLGCCGGDVGGGLCKAADTAM